MSTRFAKHVRPGQRPAVPLELVAEHLGVQIPGVQTTVTGITVSTLDMRPGDLYVAVRGDHVHGATYVTAAEQEGAVAVVTDAEGAAIAAGASIPILVVDDPKLVAGPLSAWLYGNDRVHLRTLGVTGTNGKTSTTYFMEALLGHAGVLTGLSTTAERHVGGKVIGSALTTPEAPELQALVATMREMGAQTLLIEVSAQAMSRHRIDGTHFDAVGFTNLTPEHLDEYGDVEHYYAAKRMLFQPGLARQAVIDVDTGWGWRLLGECGIPAVSLGFSENAQWRIIDHRDGRAASSATVVSPDGHEFPVRLSVPGEHMSANAAMAIALLSASGVPHADIDAALADDVLTAVYLPGRLERVSGAQGPTFFVDYAHTPDALQRTLSATRAQSGDGRLIVVLGADGGRDATKRPEMGRVSSEIADVLIVDDINPRFERPEAIRAAVLDGARAATHPARIDEVADPAAAIRAAIRVAGPDDTIIVCGPGDEDYHEVRGRKLPYSSRDAARQALLEAGWPPAPTPRRRSAER